MQTQFSYTGVGIMALASASALALEPSEFLYYQKGPMSLRPQFRLSETFNDNIYFREDDTVGDFITTISPGLELQLGSRDYNFINLSYFYDRLIYADQRSQDANQHRVATLTHFQRSRLTLSGRDEIEFLATPLGGGISVGGQKVNRRMYLDEYRLSYEYSEKTVPYLEVLHSTVDYRPEDDGGVAGLPAQRLYDSTTLIGTAGFEYKAFSRTSFFGELYYGQTENTRNDPTQAPYPTAQFIGGFVGARGNFTEKLNGSVKAGYESRSYSSGAEGSGLPVVEVSLTERFTEKTIMTLAYSRRQRESVQFARSAYISQAITANLLQHIGNEGRFRARLQAAYIMADYEPNQAFVNGRDDRIINAGLTLDYDFKLWLHGFLSYEFERLDSTSPRLFDYTVNRVSVGLNLGY